MHYYFAFGSCMHQADIARTVEAETIGPAVLDGYRLAFTKYAASREGGVADIVEASGDFVEGMVFAVPDFIELDKREGAPNLYVRTAVNVSLLATDEELTAATYMIKDKEPVELAPSAYYAGLITEGAEQLSSAYQTKLQSILQQTRKRL
ncbi:gamma-glutamylcyclotransferase family protein [Salisediminibacterium halotolerans]|uniref:Cation transport regulator ChaC n=1 Tax=Salisediminibacterium halotolerans TaxID=517425 RepID=A0A1H9TVR6_9BACI|nr:gamma-glutamylcyclotransferase family protein [Salisediminibacterium haloalkalitolerans]SES01189.1 Cation transport regulator ChaC [Salisediminibacterium haloalkalitolerans]